MTALNIKTIKNSLRVGLINQVRGLETCLHSKIVIENLESHDADQVQHSAGERSAKPSDTNIAM